MACSWPLTNTSFYITDAKIQHYYFLRMLQSPISKSVFPIILLYELRVSRQIYILKNPRPFGERGFRG